jgi:hypothetical protein
MHDVQISQLLKLLCISLDSIIQLRKSKIKTRKRIVSKERVYTFTTKWFFDDISVLYKRSTALKEAISRL